MYAAVTSATLTGTFGTPIVVEAHIGPGIPGFTVVGLPDEGCRESRDRVRAAMLSSGLSWPNKRVTINLGGSGERRGGAGVDLAIAIALLVANQDISQESVAGIAFIAELGLDGSLRSVSGLAPLVSCVGNMNVVVGDSAVHEALLARPSHLRPVESLLQLVSILKGEATWPTANTSSPEVVQDDIPDLSDVRGQGLARLALEVSAAGMHHLLMLGPPGAGKSMLAQRLPGLLPRLSEDEAFACAMIRSAAGIPLSESVATSAPFRAPHHSISLVGMVGGGTPGMRPGELSLANNGVLFLDEMGEFAPTVLDSLRQPLEQGVVRISRANGSVAMPAKCLLIAATNPCPCGGGERGACSCAAVARERYVRRFSGPLLDRFDLRVHLSRPSTNELISSDPGECSADVAQRVRMVREVSMKRQGMLNSAITPDMLDEVAPLSDNAMNILRAQLDKGELTGRGYHRIRRVARTLADMSGQTGIITSRYVHSALMLRAPIHTGMVSR